MSDRPRFENAVAVSGTYARHIFIPYSGGIRRVEAETVRLDVDGYFPQFVASGTIYGSLGGGVVHWLATSLQGTAPGVWEGNIVRQWGDSELLPQTKVRVAVSPHLGLDLSPKLPPIKNRALGCRHAHRDGVSLFGRAAFLRPGLCVQRRRAQPGSRLAVGHRRSWRAAVLRKLSSVAALSLSFSNVRPHIWNFGTHHQIAQSATPPTMQATATSAMLTTWLNPLVSDAFP